MEHRPPRKESRSVNSEDKGVIGEGYKGEDQEDHDGTGAVQPSAKPENILRRLIWICPFDPDLENQTKSIGVFMSDNSRVLFPTCTALAAWTGNEIK